MILIVIMMMIMMIMMSSNTWSHFLDHSVTEGETLAGLSLKYNITIQASGIFA